MWRSVFVGLLALGAPIQAQAEELSFSWGATVATEYVSSGVYYTDGIAFTPWVELGYGGFYAGAYAVNTSKDLTLYSAEYGVALGYRGAAGPVEYDVSLNYYMYDDAYAPDFPAEDSAEFVASGSIAASEALYVTGRVALAPEYDSTNLRLRLDYYTPVDGLSVGAAYGTSDTNYGDWEYWTIDASYAVSENVSFGLGYHDSTYNAKVGGTNGADDGLFVGSVDFSF